MKTSHLLLVALAVVLALGAQTVQATTLIDLQMNETSGDVAADSSGNGNDGTLHGYGWWWVTGHTGNGIEMIADYIQVPRSATLDITGKFHASMWVKPYGSGSWIEIPGGQIEKLSGSGGGFSKGHVSDQSGYGMWIHQTALVHGHIGFAKAGAKDFSGPAGVAADRVTAGQWNLIEMDFDGSQIYRLYVNGSLRFTGVLPEPDTVKVSTRDLYVGHEQIVGTYVDGVIDEFKITTDVAPSPGNISGAITFQDFVGDLSLVPVRIQVTQGGNIIQTQQRTFEQGGGYAVGPFTAGTYEVSFTACKFRKKVVTGVQVQDGATTPVNVTLLNGDLDGNDNIGTPDFSALSGNFGKLGD